MLPCYCRRKSYILPFQPPACKLCKFTLLLVHRELSLTTIQDYSLIRVPVVLHTIASFKKSLVEKSAALILDGLLECLQLPGPLHNEMITSPDFWVILRNLSKNEEASAMVFKILESVNTIETPVSVMADNYEPVVSLLNDYASAGSIGSLIEQKLDKRSRRPQQTKPPKAE